MIVGIRPEHFEDAMLVGDRPDGHTLKATIDVLESVGSEYYAHLTVASEPLPAIALGAVVPDHGSRDSRRSRVGEQAHDSGVALSSPSERPVDDLLVRLHQRFAGVVE